MGLLLQLVPFLAALDAYICQVTPRQSAREALGQLEFTPLNTRKCETTKSGNKNAMK